MTTPSLPIPEDLTEVLVPPLLRGIFPVPIHELEAFVARQNPVPLLPRPQVIDAATGEVVPTFETANDSFSVLQFNMLADGLGLDSFVRVAEAKLAWEKRKWHILLLIARANADLVCVEECNHPLWLGMWMSKLGYGYTFLPKARSPCRDFGFPDDGVAVFYKHWVFYPDVTHKADFGMVQELRFLHSRPTTQPRYVVLAVCHLKAKEGAENDQRRDQQFTDIQSKITLARQNIQATHAGHSPPPQIAVVWAGDFNSPPSGAVCARMRAELPWFSSAYSPEQAPYTTWKVREHGEVRHTIDYIWYEHAHLVPRRLLAIPPLEAAQPDGYPNENYPSDHMAIGAVFDFLPPV